jgi:hypothetical protein
MAENAKKKYGGQKVRVSAALDTGVLEYIFTQLTACGLSVPEIAKIVGVSKMTIGRWRKEHPSLENAVNDGKKVARAYLVAKGMRAAGGYEYTEETVEYKQKPDKDGNIVEYPAVRTVYRRHQPSNPSLLLAMLWNIDRQLGDKDWLMKPADSVKKFGGDKTVNLILDGKVAADKIDELAGKLLKQVESVEVKNGLSENRDANAVLVDNPDGTEGEPAVAETTLQTVGGGCDVKEGVS